MEKRAKELLINTIKINILGCLNKDNRLAIITLFFMNNSYKIKNQSDFVSFKYDQLIKRKSVCKIQYLH